MTTCYEEVTRKGQLEPCDKVSVAMRIDETFGGRYPVCIYHTRQPMVPLDDIREAADD